MKKYAFIASLLLMSAAFAQTSTAPVPLSPSQHGLTIASATSLTVPAGTNYAVICAKGGAANWEVDGATTPTGSSGTALSQGQCVAIFGSKSVQNFQAIQQSGNTTTLDVNFYKYQ